MFLDFDGTVVEFAPGPRAVSIEPVLIRILRSLSDTLGGALAIVSGRRIDELDWLLQPLRLPVAGLHGAERRDASGKLHVLHQDECGVRTAAAGLGAFVAGRPGLQLEDKGVALAIHYRGAPRLRDAVRSAVREQAAMLSAAFEVLEGDMVFEIKPASCNKATAVCAFMAERPFSGRRPVFVGDDITDADGFRAMRTHAGISVAVGDRVAAEWRLADPRAARSWLREIARTGKSRAG